jgi:hypothetical protein
MQSGLPVRSNFITHIDINISLFFLFVLESATHNGPRVRYLGIFLAWELSPGTFYTSGESMRNEFTPTTPIRALIYSGATTNITLFIAPSQTLNLPLV